MLPITYSQLLLICLGAGLFLLLIVLFHRRVALRTAECAYSAGEEDVEEHHFYTEYVMPLLVFERDYPSFIAILSLVLETFPISRFTRHEDVRSAFAFLREAAFNGGDPRRIATVMCVVVQSFVNDPDVEYRLRLKLPDMLDRFLREVGEPEAVEARAI